MCLSIIQLYTFQTSEWSCYWFLFLSQSVNGNCFDETSPMSYVSSLPFTAAAVPVYYSTSTPVTYSPLKSVPVSTSPPPAADLRGTASLIAEAEGNAPEDTPLSEALCLRLRVPVGTLWGPPSGQVSKQPEVPATPNKSEPPSPSLQAQAGSQV
jgi:hypothetical protein